MQRTPAFVLGAGGGIHVQIVGERARPQRRADMHVPGQRGRAAIAADLGGGERVSLVVGAEATVLLRYRDAEQARAMQIPVILGRECHVAIVRGGAAREHSLAEFPRARDDRGLLVAQAECAGIEDRRIEGGLADRGCALADLHGHDAATCVEAAWAFRN
jgi:hypothetical protein